MKVTAVAQDMRRTC